jgi:hypothetical protein
VTAPIAIGSTPTDLLSVSPANAVGFVSATVQVQSSRTIGSDFWTGYVDCKFSDGDNGVVGSAGQTPIVYEGTQGYSTGSQLVLVAQVPASLISTLSCVVVETTPPGGTLPSITVLVTSATAVSVNDYNSNYGGFTTSTLG